MLFEVVRLIQTSRLPIPSTPTQNKINDQADIVALPLIKLLINFFKQCFIDSGHAYIYTHDLIQLGLYKVEFRILEIRISGETNLKKHFLSGNWIRKKIFKGLPNRKEWCVLHNFKQPNFGRKKRLNFGFRPNIHSEFWRRPFFFFFLEIT